jgi:FkbM family methyltransferase
VRFGNLKTVKLQMIDRLIENMSVEFPPNSDSDSRQRRILRLSGDDVAVQTVYGFWLIVPAWNIDVGIGVIRDGIIEPWTNAAFLGCFGAGDHVINVGANFGFYSALAAKRVGPDGLVHAVEANPVVFPYLVKSMYWSGVPGIVRCYNSAAVGPNEHGKKTRFCFDPQFIGGGNLFSRASIERELKDCLWNGVNVPEVLDDNRMFVPRGLFQEIETEGRTLDSYIQHPIKAMLIDAEGSECFVIAGARRLIDSSPDLSIVMEWDPYTYKANPMRRPSIDEMWDFLLDDQGFVAARICPENYPGIGQIPQLDILTREQLSQIPHSDLLLRR